MIRAENIEMIADFIAELAPDGQIAVPRDVASQVPPGEKVLRGGI